MKTFSKSNKTILAIAICIAAVGVTVGTTLAFLSTRNSVVDNTFVVGSVETEVVEQNFKLATDTTITKNPQVKNVGKNPCYIRARINFSPADEGITVSNIGENWVYNENDGFYYYTQIVDVNGLTNPIFTTVNIPVGWISSGKATEEFKDFDVIVYQEAVQTQVYDTTEYAAIWKMYDDKNSAAE